MNLAGVRTGRLSDDLRDRLLGAARRAEPTYDHIGSTLDPTRWSDPAVRVEHLDVGTGQADFDAASGSLRRWGAQPGIGAHVEPPDEPVRVGGTVLVVLQIGPLYVIAPNRIVEVVDEPGRFAYAYATLPGHPERGEESFSVELLDDGTVRATIRVQAVPATLPARLAAPVVRWLQGAALRGYLRAIAAAVASPEQTDPKGT